MSKSDNARRGSFHRRAWEKYLRRHRNRITRGKARAALRKGEQPASEQHRHSALWDAW